jgi:beta-lactam-binding protein with PASTA domain
MRKWGIAVLLVAVAACITACAGTGVTPSPSTGATSADRTVPDFVGKGLQTAQDDAQAAGFSSLASYDASGRGRVQILDRDWKVCFQAPAAGSTAGSGSRIEFGVVKLDETCPATDQGAQSPAPISEGQAMPDLTGKSLKVAVASLPSSTSISAKDISGRHRLVIVQSDWTVCSQDPAPGAQFNGQPVAFGVVKYGEPCP